MIASCVSRVCPPDILISDSTLGNAGTASQAQQHSKETHVVSGTEK